MTNLAGGSALGGTSLARDYAFIVGMFIGGAMLAVLIAETLRSRPKFAFALPVLASLRSSLRSVLRVVLVHSGPSARRSGRDGAACLHDAPGLLGAAMGMVNASIANATAN